MSRTSDTPTTGRGGPTIAHDGSNRPKLFTLPGAVTGFACGPDGERMRKLSDSDLTIYLGDTEITSFGQVIIHPHPDVRLVGGVASWLHRDHLASVTVITDASGDAVTERDYLPYGEIETDDVTPGTTPEPKAFIGERFDPETGLLSPPRPAGRPVRPRSAARGRGMASGRRRSPIGAGA